MRDCKFEKIWYKATSGAKSLDLDDPQLQRTRKIPKRLENSNASAPHQFNTPKDYYRKIYYEVFDSVVVSLNERFNSDTRQFLNQLEAFAVGTGGSVEEIGKFYGGDFDEEALLRDRNDFLSITSKKNAVIHNTKDVVSFFKDNSWCVGVVPEYFKFIQLLLTRPNSTCTNERSFSTLRRLKNYLRSTMLQDRLNNMATLHVHYPLTENVDLQE